MTLRISMSIDRSPVAGQFSRRKLSQFIVEQRQRLLSSDGIARFVPRQELRNVGHEKLPGTFWPNCLIVTVSPSVGRKSLFLRQLRGELPINCVSKG